MKLIKKSSSKSNNNVKALLESIKIACFKSINLKKKKIAHLLTSSTSKAHKSINRTFVFSLDYLKLNLILDIHLMMKEKICKDPKTHHHSLRHTLKDNTSNMKNKTYA